MAKKIKPDGQSTIVFRAYIPGSSKPNDDNVTIWYPTIEEGLQRVFRDSKVVGSLDKVRLNGVADPEFACRLLNQFSFLADSEKII